MQYLNQCDFKNYFKTYSKAHTKMNRNNKTIIQVTSDDLHYLLPHINCMQISMFLLYSLNSEYIQ